MVLYIDIRTQELWDSQIEDFEAEATAKAKKIREEQIKTDKDEYLRKGKLEFFSKIGMRGANTDSFRHRCASAKILDLPLGLLKKDAVNRSIKNIHAETQRCERNPGSRFAYGT